MAKKTQYKPAPDFELEKDRIDDAVLALLYLNEHLSGMAWKTFAWDAMDRLHAKALISNPASKNKSVALTEDGARLGPVSYTHLTLPTKRIV